MEKAEIQRLRKIIRRSFCNSPDKKKYWLALLEMHVAKDKTARPQKNAARTLNSAPASAVRSGSGLLQEDIGKPPTRGPVASGPLGNDESAHVLAALD
jgi:hypothetical protein